MAFLFLDPFLNKIVNGASNSLVMLKVLYVEQWLKFILMSEVKSSQVMEINAGKLTCNNNVDAQKAVEILQ